MRADVRIIDAVKRTVLSQLLLESVVSTTPGEKLDEKLAALALPAEYIECKSTTDIQHSSLMMCLVPPPSSDQAAWWDGPGEPLSPSVRSPIGSHSLPDHPNGIFPLSDMEALSRPLRGNPFDSPVNSPLSSSPSSSEDELYTHALSLQTPIVPTPATRRPAPLPPSKPSE